MSMLETSRRVRPLGAFWVLLALLLAELLVISLAYNHAFEFECRAVAPVALCAGLGFGVVRAMAIAGALGVLLIARGAALQPLRDGVRPRLALPWLGLQLAGFAMILAPLGFMGDGVSPFLLWNAMALWLAGLAAAGIGAVLALLPPEALRDAVRVLGGWTLALLVGLAGFAPEIAAAVQSLWRWPAIATATFHAAEALLSLIGEDVHAKAADVSLGIGDFTVLVGPQCSGVEGFALIASFLAFYVWLFRDRLAFPLVWALFPVAILISWLFNVVRISVLVWIGAHVSEDLAVDGFHSHAGWMMFTILSVSLAAWVHATPLFRRKGGAVAVPAAKPPLSQDPMAAHIVPFIAFMASALLLSTFVELPETLYPLRVAMMLAALWWVRRPLLALVWRAEAWLLAALAGGAIGLFWILTAEPGASPELDAALAAMSGGGFALWAVARVFGTSLLVPLIEELFFRGYVLARIMGPGPCRIGMAALGLGISSALFAILHGRWLEAGIAGLLFGALYLRRRRIAEPVIAHMAANIVIAVWAIASQDWSVI